MSSTRISVTTERIEEDLLRAGVTPGDVLVVHSSLRAVGWIEGGPSSVLTALKHVLRPAGTLVMPTFSFNLNLWNMPAFEPWCTQSRVGKLSDVFWRQDGVRRTAHPTHSVAAWGRYAAQITAGALTYEPLGINSPLDRARRLGAKILLVGVGQNRNSTIHVAESLAGVAYLNVPFVENQAHDESCYTASKGERPASLTIRHMPGSSEGFAKLDQLLMEEGISDPVTIGNADSTIMSSQSLCERVVEILRQDPCYLLRCKNPSDISERRYQYMRRRGWR